MKLKEFLAFFVAISVMITVVASEITIRQTIACGRRLSGEGNVYGGNHTELHSWPWLVTLHLKPTNTFFCAGSLISDRHVITGEQL
jgi:secreted trypsin-like serine protease